MLKSDPILQSLSENLLSEWGLHVWGEDKQICRKSIGSRKARNCCLQTWAGRRGQYSLPSQACSQPGHSQLQIRKHRIHSGKRVRFASTLELGWYICIPKAFCTNQVCNIQCISSCILKRGLCSRPVQTLTSIIGRLYLKPRACPI